jgi:hypothetical protein
LQRSKIVAKDTFSCLRQVEKWGFSSSELNAFNVIPCLVQVLCFFIKRDFKDSSLAMKGQLEAQT